MKDLEIKHLSQVLKSLNNQGGIGITTETCLKYFHNEVIDAANEMIVS